MGPYRHPVPPLWAPWRMQFILEKKPKGCIFCLLPRQKKDRQNLILFRGKNAYVILNKFPYNNGHLMVVPNKHTSILGRLGAKTLSEMMDLAHRSMEYLTRSMGAQGHNVGFNFGHAAGAGILDHLHLHIVPRWMGDTNFMPILAGNKVMVECLQDTYDRLSPLFLSKRKRGPRKRGS